MTEVAAVIVLRGGTVDGGRADVVLREGRIEAIRPVGVGPVAGASIVDADGMVVLPSFVEPHAHLDKALTADELRNDDGDLGGAIRAWAAARERQTVERITARARAAALRLLAHGTTCVRAHCDTSAAMGLRAAEALLAVKAELADVLEVQVVANGAVPITGASGATNRRLLAEAVSTGADAVGGAPYLDDDPRAALDVLAACAADAGLPLDLHVDETLDPSVLTVAHLVALAGAGFAQAITAGHCVSLGVQPPAHQQRLAAELAAAGIGVVALPQTNLYLQGRTRTAAVSAPRAIAPVTTLRRAGVVVAGGGDNLQDPFNPLGRGDPLETAALLVAGAHLTPHEALDAVTTSARRLLGSAPVAVRAGAAADLVLVAAPDAPGVVASADPARVVLRAGRVVARTDVRRWVAGRGPGIASPPPRSL